jgi:hypothetical protein
MFQSYIRKMSDDSDLLGAQNCYKFLIEPSKTGTVLGKHINHLTAGSYRITVESPFNTPQFKVFSHSVFNFSNHVGVQPHCFPKKP